MKAKSSLKVFIRFLNIINLKYRRKGLMSFKQYWILAKNLSKYAHCILVDDFSRRIEMIYSLEYFGEENLKFVVEDKLAFFFFNPAA